MDDLAKSVIDDWNKGDADRAQFKFHWGQATELCLPDRNDYIVERTPGMKRMQRVYDATPVFACEQFANGLHSFLTSPTLQWFSLHPDDDQLANMQEVRLWFDDAADVMYSIFNGPRHNFASQSHEYYLDLGSIGTAVMAELESERSGILFSTRHLKECVVKENEEDRIDDLTRRWKYTTKQAYQAWGVKAGDAVLQSVEKEEWGKLHTFFHRVRPRKMRDSSRRDARNKPFESVYVAETNAHIISESGFDDFPYLVSRLAKVSGEIYGRGRGMAMLPDMKMLNELMKMVVKSAQKLVDPALQVPDSSFMLPIKTVPGSFNFYRAGSNDRIEPIKTGGQVELGIEMLNALRQQIMRGFYVEWMMMPSDPHDPASSGKGVTATYVLQQRDEKMRLLSPMLARLQSEFLGPLIERTFSILWKKSERNLWAPGSPFRPPPAVLSGRPWHVEYLSPIAIAQRSSQLDSVGRLMATQLQLKQMDPSAPMIINSEAVMRLTSKDVNAPAITLKTPDQLAQEAQAQQEMNAHAQLASAAGALKDGGAGVKSLAEAGAAGQPEAAAA